jgi:hypothetical protein
MTNVLPYACRGFGLEFTNVTMEAFEQRTRRTIPLVGRAKAVHLNTAIVRSQEKSPKEAARRRNRDRGFE